MAIDSIESLQDHLALALEIEHATIPLYLCAYYSIKPESGNPPPSAQIISSIVVQEMLHMSLVCNLLNAVGGSPPIDDPDFVPTYPGPLPGHSPGLNVNLQACTNDQIVNQFMAIEVPETVDAVPQDTNYDTIGQFYMAIMLGLTNLVSTMGQQAVFTGNSANQLTSDSGIFGPVEGEAELFAVTDVWSAVHAMTEIVNQGEGTSQTDQSGDPSGDSSAVLAHYYLFQNIYNGTTPLDPTYPMITNPTTEGIPAGSVHDLSQLFNDCYSLFLRVLHEIFNGDQSMISAFWPLMTGAIAPLAALLVQEMIPGASNTAGPSFEYTTTSQQDIITECQNLVSTYPSLSSVLTKLQGLPPIQGASATPQAMSLAARRQRTPIQINSSNMVALVQKRLSSY